MLSATLKEKTLTVATVVSVLVGCLTVPLPNSQNSRTTSRSKLKERSYERGIVLSFFLINMLYSGGGIMLTMLIKYIQISYYLAMFKIIRNRVEIVKTLEKDGFYEFSEFNKFVYIATFVFISMIVAVPLTIKEEFLDS